MLPTFQDYLNQQTKKKQVGAGLTMPYSNQTLGLAPNPLTTKASPIQPSPSLKEFTPVQPVGEQYNTSYGGGTGGTGGGGVAQPDDTAQKNSLYDNIKSKLGSLKSVFDGLFSSVDNVVKEKTADYQKQQGNALDDLTKQYLQTDNQTRSIMGARGLSDSSYLGDALGQNNGIYNRSFDDLGSQAQKNLGAIGQWAAAQKAGFTNQLNSAQQYVDSLGQNIGDLGLADLMSADQTLQGTIGDSQAAASNYMTNPQNMAELNKISPVNTQGTAQLASRLQALITSSAPVFAKRQIAQGLVSASGLQDENAKGYWQSQFEDMLKKAGQA